MKRRRSGITAVIVSLVFAVYVERPLAMQALNHTIENLEQQLADLAAPTPAVQPRSGVGRHRRSRHHQHHARDARDR